MSDFSRRTLVRGVAWSVPVVAVAANAPAFAASFPPVKLTFVGGEKCPGNSAGTNFNNKTYIFQFTADYAPAPGSITASTVTVNTDVFDVKRITIVGTTIYFITESSGNSANASGQGSFTYTSGMPAVTQNATFTYSNTPPAQQACSNPNI